MDVRNQTALVSNHLTWQLSYKDSQLPKETRLSMVAALVITTATWPICLLIGPLMLLYSSFNYFKARWNQYKIINILYSQEQLQEYSKKRIQLCEQQIESLKLSAISLMEQRLKEPTKTGLPIPEKKGLKDYFSSMLPQEYWEKFPWNKFAEIDFFQKSNVPNTLDKNILQELEKIRTKFNFLSKQKNILSDSKGSLEAIKKIAEMSFVKNAFKRQIAKEFIVHSILWLLPSGIFWDLYFNSQVNHRSIYENNKNFLPVGTDLQTYDDLVDAHNKLVKSSDFVVPYITDVII